MLAGGLFSAALTISFLSLPSRDTERVRIERVTHDVATAFAAISGAQVASPPPLVDYDLAAARSALLGGAFDDAVRLFDAALERGFEAPDAARDWDALIAAHVIRAGLALARGEQARARVLVARLIRYAPSFSLRVGERNPQLQTLVDDLRKQFDVDQPVNGEDIGAFCRRTRVVLVGRALDPRRVQVLRLDHCREVARAELSGEDSAAQVAAALHRPPLPDEPTLVPRVDATPPRERPSRGLFIAGGVAIGAGLGLLAPGAYFAVDAGRRRGQVTGGCTPSAPCEASEVGLRVEAYNRAANLGGALTSIGITVTLVGLVMETVAGVRERRWRLEAKF